MTKKNSKTKSYVQSKSNLGKKPTKIKHRILRLTLISVLTVLMVFEIALYISIKDAYDSSYENEAKSLCSAYSQTIENTVEFLSMQIETASKTDYVYYNTVPVEKRKNRLAELASTTQFKDFSVAYNDGTTYNDTDISDREYFIEAMAGNTSISSPVLRRTDNSVTVMVGVPASFENIDYVFYGGIESTQFSRGLDNIDMGEGSNIVVLDKHGQVIASSETQKVLDMLNYSNSENQDLVNLSQHMTAGEDGSLRYSESGTEYLVYYQPLEVNGWSIAVTANYSVVMNQMATDFVVINAMVIIILIGSIIITFRVANNISKPITYSVERLAKLSEGDIHSEFVNNAPNDETYILEESLANTVDALKMYIEDIRNVLAGIADGDLTVKSSVDYKGDFIAIGESLNTITSVMNGVFNNVKNGVNNIQQGAAQVAEGAQSLSNIAIKEAEAVDEISATLVSIQQKADNTAIISDNVSTLTVKANSNAINGEQLMKQLAEAVQNINEKSAAIKNITKTIEDIAFQTNILALNASIEAARAGEAGKGFAVVAHEVGDLASKSAEAAQNTTSLINESMEAVKLGTEMTSQASQAMISIVEDINKVTDEMNKIVVAANEQKTSVENITSGMSQIEAGMHSTTATAEQSAASSEELSSMSTSLANELARFKTYDNY